MKKREKLAIKGGEKAVTIDYQEGWRQISDQEIKAVNDLLSKGITSIGNGTGIIGEFENNFKKYVGAKYALVQCNGTSTLHSAYFAVGVGPGDEVIVPSYTWHATITPILHCCATPAPAILAGISVDKGNKCLEVPDFRPNEKRRAGEEPEEMDINLKEGE